MRRRDAADGAREGEVALPVAGLHDLVDDLARRAEGGVDVPARAGAAKAREGEGGAGKPLGDVPRRIDADHEERHPPRAGASQRRQTVTGLLIAHPEPCAHKFDVVVHLFHGGVEGLIGHDRRRGEVVGQRHAQEALGRPVRRRGAFDQAVDQRPVLQDGELIGQREVAPRTRQHLRQDQPLAMVVKAPDRVPHEVDRHDADPHAELRLQPRAGGGAEILRGGVEFGGEGLPRLIELGEVIAVRLDDVSHPVRRRKARRVGEVFGTLKHAKIGHPPPVHIGAVEAHKGLRRHGRLLGELCDLVARGLEVAEQGIAEHLLQPGRARGVTVAGEGAQIKVIGVGEA